MAPHPDDETLMAGGLIALQRARAVDVHVLAVTDGEAAYEAAGSRELAAGRRVEQLAALEELGVGADSVTRLGIPDGAAADHVGEIADAIAAFDHVGLVVAPWTGDYHCDHEAVGAAARSAVARTGGALIFGLFWTWHRRTPADLADERMLELRLDADARHRRRRAIQCHRSQFVHEGGAPQLTPELVRPIGWQSEYFISPQLLDSPSVEGANYEAWLATGVPPVTSGPSGVET
ncbi:MAG TPA: PIG-L family deacetylase [Ilumatobacteraceae bacterium]|nr:PIG-L family deacetylase [Ilumatobacteraceae bacterium]